MTARKADDGLTQEERFARWQKEDNARKAALWHKLDSFQAKIVDGWRDCEHRRCRRVRACAHADFACVQKHRASRPPITEKQHAIAMDNFRRMALARRAQLRDEEARGIAPSQPAAANAAAAQPASGKGHRRDRRRAAQ